MGNVACVPASRLSRLGRAGDSSCEAARRHSLTCQRKKTLDTRARSDARERSILEPARKLWETLSTRKITNPDWIVIYPMDSFIQLLNNRGRCIAEGCSELVKIFEQFVVEVNQSK